MFLIILKKQHHKYLWYSNLFCRASIHCPGAQTPRKKAVCVLPGTPGESGSERVLVQDRRLNGMSIGGARRSFDRMAAGRQEHPLL